MAAGDTIESEPRLKKNVLLAYSDIAAAGRSVNDYKETNMSKHDYALFYPSIKYVCSS